MDGCVSSGNLGLQVEHGYLDVLVDDASRHDSRLPHGHAHELLAHQPRYQGALCIIVQREKRARFMHDIFCLMRHVLGGSLRIRYRCLLCRIHGLLPHHDHLSLDPEVIFHIFFGDIEVGAQAREALSHE